jgi:hypothetical protein
MSVMVIDVGLATDNSTLKCVGRFSIVRDGKRLIQTSHCKVVDFAFTINICILEGLVGRQ